MTFNGTFYFSEPVLGKVTGAVFIGRGLLALPAPPSEFERANMKRSQVGGAFIRVLDRTSYDCSMIPSTYDRKKTVRQEPRPLTLKSLRLILVRLSGGDGVNHRVEIAMSLLNNEARRIFLVF